MTGPLVLGVDVGGTKLAGVALDGSRIVAERRVALGTGPLVAQVVALARELLRGDHAGPLAAIGVAVPGQVNAETGVIEMAVNLEARDLPIGPMVSSELGAPCFVEHDARAVAAWLSDAGTEKSLAYLSVGTGVSAGVVLEGRLLRGADGLAGEVGHLVADPAGPQCACGLGGCLEAIASGPAVARAAAEAMASGASSSMPASPTTADVYRAAAEGDPTACSVVERASGHLAAAIRGLALSFGVTRVVVGGGVTHAGDAFAQPLRAAFERERSASALVARALRPDALELLDPGRPVGALGAAAVARMQMTLDASATRREVGQR